MACVSGLGTPVVCLTENPPAGYRLAEHRVRVSVNPLAWRGLSAACTMALLGTNNVAAGPASVPAPALVVPDREKECAAGRLILVAEDHPVNRELISYQLALLGFACDVVNDGAQALVALEKHRYGCLITDCHMPDVSGYDLARRVREIERARGSARHLPIVAITANTAPENLLLCRDAGMDDCIVKPTRVATLREHLARWFGADGVNCAAPKSCAVPKAAEPGGPTWPTWPEPAARALAGEIEPLDLAHMTEMWGSEGRVKMLLDSFVSSVRDDLNALPPLLEHADVAGLLEWHHRLAGAVGVLQYPVLLALLQTYRGYIEVYRRRMDSDSKAQLRAQGAGLIRTCRAILDSFEQQARCLGQGPERH